MSTAAGIRVSFEDLWITDFPGRGPWRRGLGAEVKRKRMKMKKRNVKHRLMAKKLERMKSRKKAAVRFRGLRGCLLGDLVVGI